MGKRKLKEPEITNTIQNDVDSSAPSTSTVFSSLFGDIHASNDAVSCLFSDNNPFKRNPQKSAETPAVDAVYRKSDVVEVIKRKRSKEKGKIDDPGLVQEEEAAVVKKKNSNKQLKIEEKADMGFEEKSNASLEKEEKSDFDAKNVSSKMKRKRDDVEREYEAKIYGGSDAAIAEEQSNVVVGKKRKKSDDAADTMVSKEGFDDESKLLRTVFVGNLPVKVKKKLLLKEFSKFGEIESVRIRSVPLMDTKKTVKGAIMQKQINEDADSVHAYIVFKTEESAEASLSHNMAVVEGNHVRVDRACPPRKKLKGDDAAPLYDNNRTIFVGNLPFDVKDEELYQLFFGIKGLESSIEAVRVIRHPHVGMGKGIAYVLFKTREAANLAIRKRNLRIHDRELRLSHAKQDSTPSKRKDSRNAGTDAPPRKKFGRDFSASDGKNYNSTSKPSTSYQGLRANKSGTQKHPMSNGQMKFNAHQKEVTPKVRISKRPAVASRRGNAENKAGGYTGAKRKPDSRTPDSSHRHKKFKKF